MCSLHWSNNSFASNESIRHPFHKIPQATLAALPARGRARVSMGPRTAKPPLTLGAPEEAPHFTALSPASHRHTLNDRSKRDKGKPPQATAVQLPISRGHSVEARGARLRNDWGSSAPCLPAKPGDHHHQAVERTIALPLNRACGSGSASVCMQPSSSRDATCRGWPCTTRRKPSACVGRTCFTSLQESVTHRTHA